ncbi:hypothetical protein [Methanofollis formosanus]|nr:hypothetical protein [Methanofollis formosanus]
MNAMSNARYLAACIFALWFGIVAFFMLLNRALDLEVYFVLGLIGLLVLVVLVDSPFVQPRSMRRIKVLIAMGVAVFGYIVVMKVMEIIGS